jgi:hypothetical protein
MCHRRYRGDRWSVGVQQQRVVLAKMGGGPSHQGDLEVVWRGEGGARPIGTSISCLKLRDPISQGAILVNLDCGYFPEKEAEVLNHEVYSRCLWAPHALFVVAACGDHLARGAVRWSAYHFSDKVHLSRGDHVADAEDGVEHLSHFVVVEPLFADFGH